MNEQTDQKRLENAVKVLLISDVPGEIIAARNALIRICQIGPHELAAILTGRAKVFTGMAAPDVPFPDTPVPPQPARRYQTAAEINRERLKKDFEAREKQRRDREAMQMRERMRQDAEYQRRASAGAGFTVNTQTTGNTGGTNLLDHKDKAQYILDQFNTWLVLTAQEVGFVRDMLQWNVPTPKQNAWLDRIYSKAKSNPKSEPHRPQSRVTLDEEIPF